MDAIEQIASYFVEDLKLYVALGGKIKDLKASKVYETIEKTEGKILDKINLAKDNK